MANQNNGLAASRSCRPFFFRVSYLRTLQLSLAMVVVAFVARGSSAQEQELKRPNILFFLTDDQRNDQLGCAGHPILKTPSIDSLAERGVRFENAFVTTSICAASRASIFCSMTERTHRYTFGTPPLRNEVANFCYAKLLKEAGYRTGFVGKFGVNVNRGTQEKWFDSYHPIMRKSMRFKRVKGVTDETSHVTDIAGSEAISFLDSVKSNQPFCLQVSFHAPHAQDNDKENHYPWPPSQDGIYEDVKIPAARLSAEKIFDAHPDFMKQSMNRIRFGWRWDTPEKYDRNIRGYYRMLSGVDRVIGNVLKELEAKGLADNTIVIFSGDNGYYMGQRGFAGKWSHYEESLRVPLIITDLRKNISKRGVVEPAMALNVDIPATILDLAKVPPPKSYQGRSLTPFLFGKPPSDSEWRSDFFCEHLMDNKSIPKWEGVRGERYVYARYFEQKPEYEYFHDLENDPDQLTNFVADPNYKEVLQKMRRRCDELRDENGGKYDREKFKK